MATSAKEWRKPREVGYEITLPSLKVAKIRPIEVDFFLMNGTVPDPLAEVLANLINGKDVEMPAAPVQEQLTEIRDQWIPFLNRLASYALIEPRCKNEEQPGGPLADDEISVWDLSYADKVALYRLFCRPADYLEKFRDWQIKHLAAVDAAKRNGHSAQPPFADSAVGESGPGNAGSDDSTGR